MRAIDVHSHLSTEKAFFLKKREIREAEKYYKTKLQYKSEQEMIEDFKSAAVKAFLVGPIPDSVEEAKDNHDYLASLTKRHPNTFGAWANTNPRFGLEGLRELERCISDLGMIGAAFVPAATSGMAYNEKSYFPFYNYCVEADVPALLYVGMTGLGAGLPGGGGYSLDYFRPIPYVDEVAAEFPKLTVIASHPAWPWHNEMIAILLHKPNVYNDLHGWSPKYFPPELKREINGRLRDKFLFGADYPMFDHVRLFEDWEAESYRNEVMQNVFVKNAQKVLKVKI